MKRSLSFLTAAAALGLASLAHGQTSPGPQPNEQAGPAQQQTMPPGSEQSTTAPPSRGAMQSQQPMQPGSEPPGQPRGDEAAAAAPQPSGEAAKRPAAIVPSGTTTEQACAEFRSLEECATALHLAQNLNLPFNELKSRLKNGERVSAIIHDAKPQADPKAEITRAQDQARADLGVPTG